jgi:hypothetical protein
LTIFAWDETSSRILGLVAQLLPVIVFAGVLSFVKKLWVDRWVGGHVGGWTVGWCTGGWVKRWVRGQVAG